MAAYVISDIAVDDENALRDYVRAAPATVEKYGGRYLARRGALEPLEGTWQPRGIVILEFESMAQAKTWYASPEYEDIRNRFCHGATRSMIVVEGVAAPLTSG